MDHLDRVEKRLAANDFPPSQDGENLRELCAASGLISRMGFIPQIGTEHRRMGIAGDGMPIWQSLQVIGGGAESGCACRGVLGMAAGGGSADTMGAMR